MSSFPGSPKLVKGGLVVLDAATGAVKRTIALQYNPDTLTRSYQVQGVGGDGGAKRAQPFRLLKGPAIESIKLDAEIDATDSREHPDQNANAVAFGIAPQLAALESLVNPSSAELLAINAGRYTKWGTLSDTHVNFDCNLTAKTGGSEYGFATFRTNSAMPNEIRIYILLGPNALNAIGPQFTQMAFEHESTHAWDYLRDWAMQSGTPHSATPGEELAIYAEGFSRHFLDLWSINNAAPGSYQIADSFSPLVQAFASAAPAQQNDAFNSIRLFYEVRIQGIACNEMKFKIWLQSVLNGPGAGGALAARINALPGLGLSAGTGTGSVTHFNTQLGCS